MNKLKGIALSTLAAASLTGCPAPNSAGSDLTKAPEAVTSPVPEASPSAEAKTESQKTQDKIAENMKVRNIELTNATEVANVVTNQLVQSKNSLQGFGDTAKVWKLSDRQYVVLTAAGLTKFSLETTTTQGQAKLAEDADAETKEIAKTLKENIVQDRDSRNSFFINGKEVVLYTKFASKNSGLTPENFTRNVEFDVANKKENSQFARVTLIQNANLIEGTQKNSFTYSSTGELTGDYAHVRMNGGLATIFKGKNQTTPVELSGEVASRVEIESATDGLFINPLEGGKVQGIFTPKMGVNPMNSTDLMIAWDRTQQ